MRVLIILCCLAAAADAFVSLFITKAEMNRTLGVSAELLYVESGEVNTYAVKFPYRVDTHVSAVRFSWKAEASKPVSYSIRVNADDIAVLPVLRIPPLGEVPTHTEEFSVEYRCAGSKAGQFEASISLHINFTSPGAEDVRLKLKQEKLCGLKDARGLFGGGMDDFNQDAERNDLVSPQKVFYIVIGCASALLLLLILLIFVYCKGGPKNMQESQLPIRSRMAGSFRSSTIRTAQSQPFLTSTPTKSSVLARSRLAPSCSSVVTRSDTPGSTIIQERSNPVDVKHALIELHADRDLFQTLPITELEGTFGQMKWCIWRQTASGVFGDVDEEEDTANQEEAVICKTLKTTASQAHFEKFLREALVFHHVPPHFNIAHVCAAATFGRFDRPDTISDVPLLCYRHRGFGNLKKFLHSCRGGDDTNSGAMSLRTHELVSMGQQITQAMNHLHRYGVIHKDIATRNCLVAEVQSKSPNDRLHVQLCDNALAKDLFPSDYHCLGDNDNRPVKWMSPEALEGTASNSASDVWSLGVTLWELLSLGQSPLQEIAPDEVLVALRAGHRPSQPYNCPDQLYNVMFCCWKDDPKERPAGDQVLQALREFTQQLRQFV